MKQVHPKSQTTAILYQEPTQEEMAGKSTVFKRLADASAAAVLIVTVAFLTLMTVRGCSADVDQQEVAAVKHQIQFQGEAK